VSIDPEECSIMRRSLMLGLVLVAAAAEASVAQETGGVPLPPAAAGGPTGLARPLPVVLPGAMAADVQRTIAGRGLALPGSYGMGGHDPAGRPAGSGSDPEIPVSSQSTMIPISSAATLGGHVEQRATGPGSDPKIPIPSHSTMIPIPSPSTTKAPVKVDQ
jgi:hypothetical protein